MNYRWALSPFFISGLNEIGEVDWLNLKTS